MLSSVSCSLLSAGGAAQVEVKTRKKDEGGEGRNDDQNFLKSAQTDLNRVRLSSVHSGQLRNEEIWMTLLCPPPSFFCLVSRS